MKEGKYPSIHFLTLIWVQVTEAAVYPEAPSLSLGSSLHSQPAEQCNLPIVFRFAMGGLFPVGHCVKKINSRTTSTGSLWCELHILLLWESPDTFQISVISFFGLLPTAHDHRQVWECRLSAFFKAHWYSPYHTHPSVNSPLLYSLTCRFKTWDT